MDNVLTCFINPDLFAKHDFCIEDALAAFSVDNISQYETDNTGTLRFKIQIYERYVDFIFTWAKRYFNDKDLPCSRLNTNNVQLVIK
jgi:hypothetical protein